jgi:hypothetical protein
MPLYQIGRRERQNKWAPQWSSSKSPPAAAKIEKFSIVGDKNELDANRRTDTAKG